AVPGSRPVKQNSASPLASVVTTVGCAVGLEPVTLNSTGTSATGAPQPLVTVARTHCCTGFTPSGIPPAGGTGPISSHVTAKAPEKQARTLAEEVLLARL